MTARWHVLTARVPDALDDEIATVLGEGSLGVEVASGGLGTSLLRVYLGSIGEAQGYRLRAEGVLSAHGLSAGTAGLEIDPVSDERWVERWQASLAPIPLGTRFVVTPGEQRQGDGRETIRLIPGMAFGTGEHETTRLSAAALERRVAHGSRWLDLGTGTGLLAVVAARCGAARVLAVDIDPEAVAIAREVARQNAVSDVVEVRAGSIEGLGGESFDGIVANIQASFILANSAALANALVEGGVLVASGILEDDVPEVVQALGASGMSVASRTSDGPWACLLARRSGA